MKDDLKDPEIYKFPYTPFVPTAVSLTLNQLLELANKFDENYDNNKRYEDLLRLETQIISRIGKEEYKKFAVYRIVFKVDPKFLARPERTAYFYRDFTDNEAESYKYIYRNATVFGVNVEKFGKALKGITERGNFTNPMGLFRRMGSHIAGLADAASRVRSAKGTEILVEEICSLPATLAMIEVFLDFHWRKTPKCAVVLDLSLSAETQLKMRLIAVD